MAGVVTAHVMVSSAAETATLKVARLAAATPVVKAVAPARKVIPKRAVKADARVAGVAVVVVAAVVAMVDAAKAKDHHKVKVKATANVLTLKLSHKART